MALLLAAALTVAIYWLPYGEWLGWPLILLSTLVHELGHGLMALLLGGQFMALYIWPDASGLAVYQGAYSPWQQALIAATGLLGAPMAAAGLFGAGSSAIASRRVLAGFAALLLLVAVLWARNLFGFVFIVALITILGWIALKAGAHAAQFAVVFLSVQLCLSVFSRSDYLFMRAAETAQGMGPSDTAQIAAALFLPYWFWGAAVGLASVLILSLGIRRFARSWTGGSD